MTLSLHGKEEVLPYFSQDGMQWKVYAFRVANPRWDAEEHCQRSVAHTMIISQKQPLSLPAELDMEGVLSDEEYQQLLHRASEVGGNNDNNVLDGVSHTTLFNR